MELKDSFRNQLQQNIKKNTTSKMHAACMHVCVCCPPSFVEPTAQGSRPCNT